MTLQRKHGAGGGAAVAAGGGRRGDQLPPARRDRLLIRIEGIKRRPPAHRLEAGAADQRDVGGDFMPLQRREQHAGGAGRLGGAGRRDEQQVGAAEAEQDVAPRRGESSCHGPS